MSNCDSHPLVKMTSAQARPIKIGRFSFNLMGFYFIFFCFFWWIGNIIRKTTDTYTTYNKTKKPLLILAFVITSKIAHASVSFKEQRFGPLFALIKIIEPLSNMTKGRSRVTKISPKGNIHKNQNHLSVYHPNKRWTKALSHLLTY